MLKLWLYEPKDGSKYIHSAGIFFDAEYEEEWITEDIVKDMIADVDKSTVISGRLIDSPILGPIPPTDISSGVKTLIMARNDNSRIYNLTSCGDNCAKWAIKIAEDRDVIMRLGHFMNFEDAEPFQIQILNTGVIVTTQMEFINEMVKADIEVSDGR